MTLQDIQEIMARSIEIGYLQAMRTIEPTSDELRQTEVRKWLKTQNIKSSTFDAMVQEGLVRGCRKGSATNSPIYYSKQQIKQALMIVKVEEITNK